MAPLPIQAREAASRASNKKLLEALKNINKSTTITGQNASIQSPTQIPTQSKEDESTRNVVPSEQNVAVQNPTHTEGNVSTEDLSFPDDVLMPSPTTIENTQNVISYHCH